MPRRERSCSRLGPADIGKRFSIGGRRGAEATSLSVGQFGVLFLHVPLATERQRAPQPSPIGSRGIAVQQGRPDTPFTLTIAETPVIDANPVLLGPPLIGKGYLAGDGCCDTIRHVRALLPLNGRFALAQRFAIDWEQVDEQNRLVKGDLSKVENYTIFGKDVIAVRRRHGGRHAQRPSGAASRQAAGQPAASTRPTGISSCSTSATAPSRSMPTCSRAA